MPLKMMFFDLDSTLYPERNGLWKAIRERIDLYLLEEMGFPASKTGKIRQKFLDTYGTTLRGLQEEFQIDAQEYLNFVHDLPLEQYLFYDPALVQLINQLPRPRWIFTNSDRKHALRVLEILGLMDAFDGIIDINRLQFVCKPDPAAYHRALRIANFDRPEECVLLDDSVANVRTAARLGFQTVLVSESSPPDYFGISIPDIYHLPKVLPHLQIESDTEHIGSGNQ